MKLSLVAIAAAGLLTGCGLAETTTVAASEAAANAEAVKHGKEAEEKVKRDIEAAEKAAKEARDKAEAATE